MVKNTRINNTPRTIGQEQVFNHEKCLTIHFFHVHRCAEVTMWDERYAGKEYFYGKEPNDFLKENIAHIAAGERVLCLAEGEGRNAVYIAKTYPTARVTAVDASKVGLEKTKQLA